MSKEELEDWHNDWENQELSSGAYILYLRMYITEIEEGKEKYNELLFAVESKFENESRHETALRYITQHERSTNSPVKQMEEGEQDE